MDTETVYARVNAICDDFQNTTDTRISSNTRNIAASIIAAIVEDPHPRWQWYGNRDRLEQAQQMYLNTMPWFLSQIAVTEGVDREITTFDFLHWFSKTLDFTLCIIPK